MLRYYSYYSVGGYKDMFLGTSEDKEQEVFYLPLLPVWKSRAEKNGETGLLEKVNAFSKLPSIKILTNKEMYGLPVDALPAFSRGGYKVLLKRCSTGEGLLVIRDIDGEAKDDAGRAIPFLICFVGETEDDLPILDKLYAYMAMNLCKTEQAFSKLFEYDAERNGEAFLLGKLNEWVSYVSEEAEAVVTTRQRTYSVDVTRNDFLTMPLGIEKDFTIREQSQNRHSTVALAMKRDGTMSESGHVCTVSRKLHTKTAKIIVGIGGGLIAGLVIYEIVRYVSK